MVTGLLVLSRCTGFAFRAPGFAHPSVPASVRAGLAILLAVAVLRGIPTSQHAVDGAAFIIAATIEFMLGSAIGMAASVVYDGAYAGGRVVDDYVGVKAMAPSLQLVAPSGFGRIWSLAFTGAFFLTGSYRLLLWGFAQSFVRIPVGVAPAHYGWASFAAGFITTLVTVAAQVAAPAIGAAFIVQIALGALSRVVPRFGSFAVAFPMAFAAAVLMTAIAAPLAAPRAPAPVIAMPGVVR